MTFKELREEGRRFMGGYYNDGNGHIGVGHGVGLWGAAIAWYSFTPKYGYQLCGSTNTREGASFVKVDA